MGIYYRLKDDIIFSTGGAHAKTSRQALVRLMRKQADYYQLKIERISSTGSITFLECKVSTGRQYKVQYAMKSTTLLYPLSPHSSHPQGTYNSWPRSVMMRAARLRNDSKNVPMAQDGVIQRLRDG